jgi:hypothetical protein
MGHYVPLGCPEVTFVLADVLLGIRDWEKSGIETFLTWRISAISQMRCLVSKGPFEEVGEVRS